MHHKLLAYLLGLRYRFTPAYGVYGRSGIGSVCGQIKLCRLGWIGSVIPAGSEILPNA